MKRTKRCLSLLLLTAILLVVPAVVNASVSISIESYSTSISSPSTAQVDVKYYSNIAVYVNLKLIDSNNNLVGTEVYYDEDGEPGAHLQAIGTGSTITIPYAIPSGENLNGCTWKVQMFKANPWDEYGTADVSAANVTISTDRTAIDWTVEPPTEVAANATYSDIRVSYNNNSGGQLYLQVRLNNSYGGNLGSKGYYVDNGTYDTNKSIIVETNGSVAGEGLYWKCQLMDPNDHWNDEVTALSKDATVGESTSSTEAEIQIGFYTDAAYNSWWVPTFEPMDDMAWMGADYYIAYENRSQLADEDGQPTHKSVEHTVLQGAATRGLKAHYCMKSLWENTLVSESVWKEVINEYKDEPGLGAWYIADEPEKMDPESGYQDPNVSVVNIIQERQEWTEEADGNHNTSYCEYDYEKGVALISTIVDDVIYDHYPVDNRLMDGDLIKTDEMRKIGAGVEAYRNATDDLKNIISAPQLFAFDQYEEGTYYYAEGGRYPTMNEVKAMTYEAIIHGAKGICFYHWRDFSEWSTYDTDKYTIQGIITELKSLSDVIMSGTRVSTGLSFPVDYSDIPEVDYQRWTYDGDDYLIVCNLTSATKISNITMSGVPSSVEVLFQDRNLSTSNSIISESMEAYEVDVYKW